MKPLLPDEAPQHPEDWQNIMGDIERVIMPGVSHLRNVFKICFVHHKLGIISYLLF